MKTNLAKFLDEQFAAIPGSARKNEDRAAKLGVASTTYSKILNGSVALAPERAQKWAAALAGGDSAQVAKIASQLLNLSGELRGTVREQPKKGLTEFWKTIRGEGKIAAVEISQLFEALREVEDPLVCVEYRDIPTAGPTGKYQALATSLGLAVANGVKFAMFQPFTNEVFVPSNPDEELPSYLSQINKIRRSCRESYKSFRQISEKEAEKQNKNKSEIGERVRLYERNHEHNSCKYFGSGFQTRFFYIQYKIASKMEKYVLQWATTIEDDELIYIDEKRVDPEAVKESFFPVAHYFDLFEGKLPNDVDEASLLVRNKLGASMTATYKEWADNYKIWKIYDDDRTS